jgi:hypothetical protein
MNFDIAYWGQKVSISFILFMKSLVKILPHSPMLYITTKNTPGPALVYCLSHYDPSTVSLYLNTYTGCFINTVPLPDLRHLGSLAFGHSGSRAYGLMGLGLFGTWAFGHMGTWSLRHLGSWARVNQINIKITLSTLHI